MNKKIEARINKIYKALFKKIFTKETIKQATWSNPQAIIAKILRLENSKSFDKFAKEFSKKLTMMGLTKKKGMWRKFYEAAKRKHYIGLPKTFSEFEKKIYANIVKENFKMIKSVPEHILKVYEQKDIQTILGQVLEGRLPRGAFEKSLKEHGYKNSKLIARTETAKLQTAIEEARATDLGSVAYIWSSSNDRRTRPSHRKMNEVVVFWRKDKEKPHLDNMWGNAGEFPNCRCTTLPIFDEEDLDKPTYNVYNYQTEKIVKIGKQKLIELMEQGGF